MKTVLFLKAQVAGYTRSDGVVVKPHSDKRTKRDVAARTEYFVTFGNKKFQVDSLEDAAHKWNAYRDRTGAGVSEVGNGVEVHDLAGKLLGRVSYNGRVWNADGTERVAPAGPQKPVVFRK